MHRDPVAELIYNTKMPAFNHQAAVRLAMSGDNKLPEPEDTRIFIVGYDTNRRDTWQSHIEAQGYDLEIDWCTWSPSKDMFKVHAKKKVVDQIFHTDPEVKDWHEFAIWGVHLDVNSDRPHSERRNETLKFIMGHIRAHVLGDWEVFNLSPNWHQVRLAVRVPDIAQVVPLKLVLPDLYKIEPYHYTEDR